MQSSLVINMIFDLLGTKTFDGFSFKIANFVESQAFYELLNETFQFVNEVSPY